MFYCDVKAFYTVLYPLFKRAQEDNALTPMRNKKVYLTTLHSLRADLASKTSGLSARLPSFCLSASLQNPCLSASFQIPCPSASFQTRLSASLQNSCLSKCQLVYRTACNRSPSYLALRESLSNFLDQKLKTLLKTVHTRISAVILSTDYSPTSQPHPILSK
jgi:hypothetical protein